MTSLIIDKNGNQIWYNKRGQYHRENGPAIIYTHGRYYWYVNGNMYHNNKSFREAASLSDEDMSIMILKYGDVK
jgi:hypothetical protein